MRYHKLEAGQCPGTYVVTEPVTEQDLLRIANQIARKRLAKGTAITRTTEAAERLQTLLQDREHEVFGALFLDSQHRVLAFEELFRGTLDSASIYPREVVKRALLLNCGAIIAVHNHPSGDPEPSQSDRVFTQALKEALALVDIRLLDHLSGGWCRGRSLVGRKRSAMNQTPGKSHLTTLDILLELRCWLADNIEMQAEPAIVAHLPNGYLLTQADCIEAIDTLLHQLRH